MALDDRIDEVRRSFATQLQGALDALASDLTRAATEERDAAVARATETLRAEMAEAVASTKADAEHALQEAVARVREEVEEAALARVDAVRADAQTKAAAEVARMADELAQVRADAEEAALAKIDAVRAEADASAQVATDRLERELARARADAEATLNARIDAARTEARHAAEAEIGQVRQQAEESIALARARATIRNGQAAEWKVTQAVVGERQSQLACVERLLSIVRRFDDCRSLTDVLETLAEGAASEAPRVAILTLHGDRLRSWRFVGFAPAPGFVDLELDCAGVMGRAVRTRQVAVAEPASPQLSGPAGPGFATLPADRVGLAAPLLVGGTPVAVLYADDVSDDRQMKPAPWPETIELLARHAAIRLENLTALRTAQALGVRAGAPTSWAEAARVPDSGAGDDESARRYARLLISEIKLYNEGAVRVGRQQRDLASRLRDDISRARRLYEERVPETVRARLVYFDDELVQTLADGDPSLLGPRSDALA